MFRVKKTSLSIQLYTKNAIKKISNPPVMFLTICFFLGHKVRYLKPKLES